MKAISKTITMTKPELRALLDFASTDSGDPERYGVQFSVSKGKVFARATNLARSVTCQGEAEKGLETEVFVTRAFLTACAKVATGSSSIVIKPTVGSTWIEGRIGSQEELDAGHGRVVSDPDGSASQLELPNVAKDTRIPRGAEVVPVTALPAVAMKSLTIVGKAVGSNAAVECFASDSEDEPSIFRCGNGAVQWTVAILPWKTEATSQSRKANSKQGELPLDEQPATDACSVPAAEATKPRKSNKPVDPTELAEEGRRRSKARVESEKSKKGKGSK